MDRPVGLVVVPCLAGAERPRAPLGEPVALRVGGLERRELGARVGIERGPQRARELARGERAENVDLGGFEGLGDPLGFFEQGLCSGPARVDLYGEQDLVLLGNLCGGPDQLEVGLDHRGAARRHRRVTLGLEPARELVALRGGGALDPLDPPDRGAGGAGRR